MERYPHFHFAVASRSSTSTRRTSTPAFTARSRMGEDGRWETAGAMWVEADCNVTSGESLVRQNALRHQVLPGGVSARAANVLAAGRCSATPPACRKSSPVAAIEYFYTYSCIGSPRTRSCPPVRWRGLDGSEVLAHVVNHVGAYNNYLCPSTWPRVAPVRPEGRASGSDLPVRLRRRRRRGDRGHAGAVGDRPRPVSRPAGCPHGNGRGILRRRGRRQAILPVWDGELYVETHRGTYTTQSAMKRANRLSEILLRGAEILGSLAALTGGLARSTPRRFARRGT